MREYNNQNPNWDPSKALGEDATSDDQPESSHVRDVIDPSVYDAYLTSTEHTHLLELGDIVDPDQFSGDVAPASDQSLQHLQMPDELPGNRSTSPVDAITQEFQIHVLPHETVLGLTDQDDLYPSYPNDVSDPIVSKIPDLRRAAEEVIGIVDPEERARELTQMLKDIESVKLGISHERGAAILDMFEQGTTLGDIARSLHITKSAVEKIIYSERRRQNP